MHLVVFSSGDGDCVIIEDYFMDLAEFSLDVLLSNWLFISEFSVLRIGELLSRDIMLRDRSYHIKLILLS